MALLLSGFTLAVIIQITYSAEIANGYDATCGDTLKGYFNSSNTNNTHIYGFYITNPVSVNFHTCNSNTDIVIYIFDENYDAISEPYCAGGDLCGNCNIMPATTFIENFTMPIMDTEEQYYVVAYYFEEGPFEININCEPLIDSLSKVFVSKNGTDYDDCGDSIQNACGTLYTASLRASDSGEIYVFDGQNEAEITHYLNQSIDYLTCWDICPNPCIPDLNNTWKITITFNPTLITILDDWYPKQLCPQNQSVTEGSMFLSSSITVNNLVINDYNYEDYKFHSFIKSDGLAICNNCKFMNILMNFTQSQSHSLIESSDAIVVNDNKFINIYSTGNMIFNSDGHKTVISNTHFINVSSKKSLILLSARARNLFLFRSYQSHLTPSSFVVNNCTFSNISTDETIIDDTANEQKVYISNSSFDVIHGSIYISDHGFSTNVITLNGLSVTTSNTNRFIMNKQLFFFTYTDRTDINNIDITYTYHTNVSCYVEDAWSCRCRNPVAFIHNYGVLEINNININVNINKNSEDCLPYMYYTYEYFGDSNEIDFEETSLLINRNEMHITNISCTQTLSSNLLQIFFSLSRKLV